MYLEIKHKSAVTTRNTSKHEYWYVCKIIKIQGMDLLNLALNELT